MKSSYIIILSWLGIPAEAATVGVFFLLLHNIYVHFDLDWDHGPLQYLIASPRFHRWHHANEPEAYGKNLANVIPLFDVMFGTYYNPGKCDKKMGADGVPHDDVAKLILFPFAEWGRIIKRAFVKKTEKKPFVEPAE